MSKSRLWIIKVKKKFEIIFNLSFAAIYGFKGGTKSVKECENAKDVSVRSYPVIKLSLWRKHNRYRHKAKDGVYQAGWSTN